MAGLLREYSGRVGLVYRHFPLSSIHPFAYAAALASECAGARGRFERYHDVLFEKRDSIGVKTWVEFAVLAGIADTAGFTTCVARRQFADRVERDIAAARGVGATSTPTLIINGWMVAGTRPPDDLRRWIDDALDGRPPANR